MKQPQRDIRAEFYAKVVREAYGDHPHRETICIALFISMLTVAWFCSMISFV